MILKYLLPSDTKHEVHLTKKEKKAPVKKDQSNCKPIKEVDQATVVIDNMVAKSYLSGNERILAKAPKKFMLPLMFKQMNDDKQIPAPRKMLQLYIEKTEKAIKKENESKTSLVDENSNTNNVDEKGDRIKPEGEVDSDVHENRDVTVKDEKENENSSKDKIDLDFLKVFGTIKEVNEFLDMESKYLLEH